MFKVLKKNAVFKNSAIYMGTDAFSRAIAFLLLPIISKYLVPEQLGIAANFDVLQSILALLAGQAVVNSIPYFFYKMSKKEMAVLITNLIYLIIILNVFFSCVILFSSGIIEQYLKIKLWLQVLTVVSVISMLITEIDKLVFRLEDKPYKFAILQLLQSFLYIGLQVVMVIFLEMQALGRIYSTVLSVGIVCVLHICILYRKGYIVLKYDRQSMEKLLKFGLPLLPHSISFWLKSGLDKVLLTTYCGLAVNGLYSMAMTFGAIYTMCEQSFSRAYTPYLQKRLSFINEQTEFVEKRKIVKMTYGFGVMFLLLLLLLIPFCWLVINNLVDAKYIPCFTFIPFILIARTIHAYYSLIVEYIYTAQKTLGLGIITFSGSACQLLLTFLFVKGLGASGINFSLILGEVLIMLSVWYYSNKVYPMPWFSFFRKK